MRDMQRHMSCINDSGEYQEVESNHSGRMSHVPSQPEVIPSSSSMLSRDKRLPLDTWNIHLVYRKTFLVSNSLLLVRSKFLLKEIHHGVAHKNTKRERQHQFDER